MTTIVNRKLGETKGLRRVWLVGEKLARENYKPGDRYDVRKVNKGLVAEVKPNGKYVVSRRKRSNGEYAPLIDLTATELAELFDGIEKLRIEINRGHILITAHHHHQKQVGRERRFLQKLRAGEPLDVMSLFHGGGILDRAIHDGYQRHGITTRLALVSELNKQYLDCSMRNNRAIWDENTIAIEGALEDADLQRLRLNANVAVLGPPCVGASKSGKAKNGIELAEQHTAAGAAFFGALDALQTLNPALIWMEQVVEYLKTASWAVIRSVLESLGYHLEVAVLDGHELGALEKRRRMVCLAISKGLLTGFDINQITPIREREACLGEILEDIPEDSERWRTFKYLADKEVRDVKNKKGFRRQLLTPESPKCGVIGRGCMKNRGTEPFLKHPTKRGLSRRFTILEHARVKTIDPALVAGESETVANEIMGQSVIKCAFEAAASQHAESLMAAFLRQMNAEQAA